MHASAAGATFPVTPPRPPMRTPVLVGLLAVGVYGGVAFAVVRPLGMLGLVLAKLGLVLANSAQVAAHAVVMWLLVRRVGGPVGWGELGRLARRRGAAASAAALLTFTTWMLRRAA